MERKAFQTQKDHLADKNKLSQEHEARVNNYIGQIDTLKAEYRKKEQELRD